MITKGAMQMKEQTYTVNEIFEVLKEYKVTSNVESVRRWLRDGTIKGIAPTSRKEGWKVTQTALDAFLTDRVHGYQASGINTTNDATIDAMNVVKELEVANDVLAKQIQELQQQLEHSRANELRLNDQVEQQRDLYEQLHAQLLEEREAFATERHTIQIDECERVKHQMILQGVFEGSVVIRKSVLCAIAEQRNFPTEHVENVWKRLLENSKPSKQPRIHYLLDAFVFEREQMQLEEMFETKEEQVVHAILARIYSEIE